MLARCARAALWSSSRLPVHQRVVAERRRPVMHACVAFLSTERSQRSDTPPQSIVRNQRLREFFINVLQVDPDKQKWTFRFLLASVPLLVALSLVSSNLETKIQRRDALRLKEKENERKRKATETMDELRKRDMLLDRHMAYLDQQEQKAKDVIAKAFSDDKGQ